MNRSLLVLYVAILALAVRLPAGSEAAAAESSEQTLARQIFDATGVQGGLIVHLGCGDGKLTAALHVNDSVLVQGLDADPKQVAAARQYIQSLGLYGNVSIEPWSARRLPYADNLVNLVVVERLGDVTQEERLRVLAPGGIAYVKSNGHWTKTIKPWPKEIDQWSHYLHDASGNPVAHDQKVGPPRQLQWVSEPRWCRSHEVDISIAAVVSTQGRVFSIVDEAPIGIHDTPLPPAERRFPDKWTLVARDAFNGVLLWKRPVPQWGASTWEAGRIPFLATTKDEMWALPPTLTRRLVAVGDRLYATLGYRAAVSELEAAGGKTLREFADTATTEEIIVCDGVLLARVCKIPDGDRPQPPAAGGAKGKKAPASLVPAVRFPEATVVAIDLSSGKTLWKKPAGPMIPLTLAAAKGAVCYLNAQGLTALDLRSGVLRWQAAAAPRRGNDAQMGVTLLIAEDKVLFVADGVYAHALADGKLLWHSQKAVGASFRGVPDLLVANGLVWAGTMTTEGIDLQTGATARTIDASGLFTAGHHPRCYRAKATEDYLIWSKRGVEFVDIRGGQNHSGNDWCRSVCRYGVMPCNGLLYVPPTPCRCQPGVQMTGFNAFAAAGGPGKEATGQDTSTPRLEYGPAYSSFPDSQLATPDPADWPTYRKDNARSSNAGTDISAALKPAWMTKLQGRISPPVLAAGSLYVAAADTHTVHCLDAETGKQRWSYTAGGPIDSPPTIAQGRAIFGCADGAVYCLDAADGKLAWRFSAAPCPRTIVSYGRLESAWPVHGSVLVKDDVAYCSAGRSSFLDGGIYLYGLELRTGKVRYERRLDGPWSVPDEDRHPHAMEGTNSDLLVGGGDKLFMLQYAFNLQLERLDAPMLTESGLRRTDCRLLATGGLLDDSGFDRLCWRYSEFWPGSHFALDAPKTGQMLVFDGTRTYAAKYFNTMFSRSPHFTPGAGYDLIADENANDLEMETSDRGGRRSWSAANIPNVLIRQQPPKWQQKVPVRVRAMVLAGPTLLLAGPPDVVAAGDPYAAFEGRKGAMLWAVSAADGKRLSEATLDAEPVFDGMLVAHGRLYIVTVDGRVLCMAGKP